MSDRDLLLSDDTHAFHRLVCGPSKLHPSYFRILIVLRDYNTSPTILSQITGLGLPRIRQRLKQMKEYGVKCIDCNVQKKLFVNSYNIDKDKVSIKDL